MRDYSSNFSGVNLYDIPEFPGYGQLQVGREGEPDFEAFVEKASQGLPQAGTDSHHDLLFAESSPHVTPIDQLIWHPVAPREIFRTEPTAPAALSHSTGTVSEETRAQREQRLLRRIIANPRQRKERAAAIHELQKEADKLNLESRQAPFQISEIQKLAQSLASKTEKTASELFVDYVLQARKRHQKSLIKNQRLSSGSRPSERLSQSPEINLDGAKASNPVIVNAVLLEGEKLPIRKTSGFERGILALHNAVHSGTTVERSKYNIVRDQIKQLARDLGIDHEVEVAKFSLLYRQRSYIPE